MAMLTAASEAMRIDSSGNVGIGTSSPSSALHLKNSTGSAATLLRLETGWNNPSGNKSIEWTDATNTLGRISVDYTAPKAKMRFGSLYNSGYQTGDVMTLTADGNVGIGTSSPVTALEISTDGTDQLTLNRADASISTNNTLGGIVVSADDPTANRSGAKIGFTAGDNWTTNYFPTNIIFSNDASGTMTERMRITSAGDVLVGTTSTGGKLNIAFTGASTSNYGTRYYPSTTGPTAFMLDFIDYQGQRMGDIRGNTSTNTTAYNTSSDYRLKENVNYTWDATTRLKQLRPARFNWIRDESNTLVDGFLAHEVEDIVPESISGVKDATETKTNAVVNSYGNYIADNVTEEEWLAGKEDGTYDADTTWAASHTQNLYQGIDQSKLVPLLVKTIQELEARITALES
jgi:hypothetical protein